MPDGKVRIRGKAWPTGEAEPEAWAIDKTDPIGNHLGAPGVFAAAQFGAYLDNVQVTANTDSLVLFLAGKTVTMNIVFDSSSRVLLGPDAAALALARRRASSGWRRPTAAATGRCGEARRAATWSRT